MVLDIIAVGIIATFILLVIILICTDEDARNMLIVLAVGIVIAWATIRVLGMFING